MEKLVYVLWRPPDADPAAVEAALRDEVGPALLATGAPGVRLTVEEPAGSVMRVGNQPDGGLLCATVSVWLDSLDNRGPHEDAIRAAGCTAHGYLVTESVPLAYGDRRTWPDGERSPGISITTVFDKRPDISDETFYGIWHGEHTPLSFDIHPIWLYVRNSVARPVTDGAPRLRSIVYEAVPTVEDMLDFHRFFGSGGDKQRLKDNIARVNNHMATFADISTLETTPTSEYILRTLST
jgi:hypothetical protein